MGRPMAPTNFGNVGKTCAQGFHRKREERHPAVRTPGIDQPKGLFSLGQQTRGANMPSLILFIKFFAGVTLHSFHQSGVTIVFSPSIAFPQWFGVLIGVKAGGSIYPVPALNFAAG